MSKEGNLFVASTEYLIKQFLSPDKRSLDLSNYNLGDKGAREITQSPQLKRGKLRSLRLPNNSISDEGAKDIANCEYFKNLTELDLYGNVISDDGVKAIATSPNFARLKKLGLYGNLIEDEGAIAIAESEVLNKVTHLYISANRRRFSTDHGSIDSASTGQRRRVQLPSNGLL